MKHYIITIVTIASPLSAQSPLSILDGKITFQLEDMMRIESRDNTFDFNDSIDHINDDDFLINRFRVGALIKPTSDLTFYIQGQDSQELYSNRPDIPGVLSAEGDDDFDLRQLFAEWNTPLNGLSVKLGRQTLLYADQRLIGSFEWNGVTRTFDAAKIHWQGANGLWIDGFIASPVQIDSNSFNESNDDIIFSGAWLHLANQSIQETDIFLLHLRDKNRQDNFFTLGSHIKSKPGTLGAWDYEAEAAVQSGTANNLDLTAFAIYGELGYTCTHTSLKPRLSLEYSFGSGDSDATDGDISTFQNLFPTNHVHYGFMDTFSWSNMHDVCLHFSIKPSEKWMIGADFHSFWLADTSDAWTRANNRTSVRAITPGASSHAGTELDLLTTYTVNEHLAFTAGYSHFFAGSYLDDTGAGDDADFGYLMTQIKF